MKDTFTPKDAVLTRAEVWSFFYNKEDKKYFEYASGKLVKLPKYTANEISDEFCQEFVDEHHYLCSSFEHEEDRVDATNELVRKFHRKIVKVLKG